MRILRYSFCSCFMFFLFLTTNLFFFNKGIAQKIESIEINGGSPSHIYLAETDDIVITNESGVLGLNKNNNLWYSLTQNGYSKLPALDFIETPKGSFVIDRNKVYKSLNRQTWAITSQGINILDLKALIYEPIRKEIWVASANNGLKKSVDYGDSWTDSGLNSNLKPIVMQKDLKGQIWVAFLNTDSIGIYNPNMNSWTFSKPLKDNKGGVYPAYFYHESENLFWCIGTKGQVLKSKNGIDWQYISTQDGLSHIIKSQKRWLGSASKDGVIFESLDSARTWKAIFATPFGNKLSPAIRYNNKTILWGVSEYGFVQLDEEKNTLVFNHKGLQAHTAKDISLLDSKPSQLIAVSIPNFGICINRGLLDGNKKWDISNKGLTSLQFQALVAYSSDTLFTSCYGGQRLFRTVNSGVEWKAIAEPQPQNIDPITQMIRFENTLYALKGTKVFLSTNRGDSWDSLPQIPTPSKIMQIIKTKNGNAIYLATATTGIWEFDFQNQTWTEKTFNLDKSNIRLTYYDYGSKLLAIVGNNVYMLDNTTWKPLINNVTDDYLVTDAVCSNMGRVWLTSNLNGVEYLLRPNVDETRNWTKIPIEGKSVRRSVMLNTENSLFASNGEGLFHILLLESSQNTKLIEESMSVYPNPAKDLVRIQFHKPISDINQIQIELYNSVGQKIQLDKDIIHFMNSEVAVNIMNLNTGVYRLKCVLNNGVYQTSLVIQAK